MSIEITKISFFVVKRIDMIICRLPRCCDRRRRLRRRFLHLYTDYTRDSKVITAAATSTTAFFNHIYISYQTVNNEP